MEGKVLYRRFEVISVKQKQNKRQTDEKLSI